MSKTKIPWAEMSWNPMAGCTKVSPGCDNCYAEKMAVRLSGMPQATNKYSLVVSGGKWNNTVSFNEGSLKKPFEWKNPKTIFVVSMGDLFHEHAAFTWIDRIFTVMACNPQHTFILLTKRPERALMWFNWRQPSWKNEGMQGDERIRYYCYHNYGVQIEHKDWQWPLKNVWVGVTAENQEQADKRIPILLDIPAAVHFVSVEPMLEEIYLENYLYTRYFMGGARNMYNKIDWVVCGAESGAKRRTMDMNWARILKNQCIEAGVPFFFKQAHDLSGKVIHMPELDGQQWAQKPII